MNKSHLADPDTAYRYAKGMSVTQPYHRARAKIDTPLNFLLVSDHAELLDAMRGVKEGKEQFDDLVWCLLIDGS